MTRFAIATRDELWSRGRLLERRLSHGEAVEDTDGIVASDARDDALVAACDVAMEDLRACVLPEFRMRLVAEATAEGVTRTMVVSDGVHSIVSAPEFLAEDVALLRVCGMGPMGQTAAHSSQQSHSMLWKHGTAAVLLHEAFGHAREHGHAELEWPQWLHVDVDLAMRRETFRDVPLLRMKHVVATQQDAPFELPPERIEILLVEGGIYEPLTETVTLRIAAADLVEHGTTTRIAPFTHTATRQTIARSLLGATGEPLRYPGVICSREGQELVVPSWAPLILTEAL
ncbi:MAG TPA: hypothetical protein VEK57_04340 [Thermoanaerobaculia bacterium]|nr:hypothetical protein [Thermoanaerobaculia bacterium]